MKKFILILGIAVFIFTNLIPAVFAEDDAFTKFGRGMANILISPAELYAQPWLLMKDQPIPIAICGGLMKGIAMLVAREAVGIYEVLTFPIPVPSGYRAIIEPSTTFTDWDARKA